MNSWELCFQQKMRIINMLVCQLSPGYNIIFILHCNTNRSKFTHCSREDILSLPTSVIVTMSCSIFCHLLDGSSTAGGNSVEAEFDHVCGIEILLSKFYNLRQVDSISMKDQFTRYFRTTLW